MSSPKPKNRKTPLYPTPPHVIHVESTGSPVPHHPDFLTTALHGDWETAFNWAIQHGIKDQFYRVMITCQIWSKPILFGSLLTQISSPRALDLLDVWRVTEPAAGLLYDLAIAADDSRVRSFYRKITDKVPAKKHLPKELGTHYLMGMLIERLPLAGKTGQEWFEQLRLWLLTHAIERSNWNNLQDNHLRFVCARLRMACDTNKEWRNFFLRLQPPPSFIQDFDSLNLFIISKAEQLKSEAKPSKSGQLRVNAKTSSISPTQNNLLNNLLSVARYEESKDSTRFQLPPFFQDLFGTPVIKESTDHSPVLDNFLEDDSVAFTTSDTPEDDQRSEDVIIGEVDIDENLSYAHQMLEAGKIFLSAAEELQHLPWSWHKPNIFELRELDKWIRQNQASSNEGDRILSALLWITLNTGNSLRRALDIPFSKEIGFDWALHPDTLTLQRLPPQRLPGWKPKDELFNWVNPIADSLALPIPKPLATIIKKCRARHTAPKLLGDLWNPGWGKNQEDRFRSTVGTLIPRLTPGILGGALFQNVCMASGDPVLARLFASHKNSALPGACSYPGWNFSQLQPILAKIAPDIPAPPESHLHLNVIGSQLDPIETLLTDSIRKVTTFLRNLDREKDPIKFHNFYTAYLAVMLLGATGGRPVIDPFEKLSHFDFSECFVFIDDKASSGIQRGRLVPLPNQFCQFIASQYLTHLKNIAHTIKGANPELADDVIDITDGNSTDKMPFLFFLAEDMTGWESVSEKSIKKLGLFDWPLPLNLFRHRISRKLRHMGADPEVVDALLDHAEAATPTHGDYSFRIWADDMNNVRPLLEKLFSELGFVFLPGWKGHSISLPETSRQSGSPSANRITLFGTKARKQEREQNLIAVKNAAAEQIKQYLNGRSLSELSPDDLHKLTQTLLFMENGMLHPRGYIKYQYLLDEIDQLWKQEGKILRIKKRYIMMQEEPSRFTAAASGAIGLFNELREKLAEIAPASKSSKISHKVAADAAIVFLCLENRITSEELLQDVLNRKNFRLVTLQGRPHLEHSRFFSSMAVDTPVKRYKLSAGSAHLIDAILGAKISRDFEDHPIPDLLQPIADILLRHRKIRKNATIRKLISALIEVVEQVNVMTWPGIAAGYLAERVESFSLMWRDFTRLELGYAIQTPTEKDSEDEIQITEKSISPKWKSPTAAWHLSKADATSQQQAAQSIFKEIGSLLKHYRSQKSGPYAVNDRKEMKRKMLSMLDDAKHFGKISSTIRLLVLWGCDLLHRKKAEGFIAISTIERYFDALTPPFEKVAFSADLLSMDEDDVTHLYTLMIESLEVKDTQYVAERLGDFHQWARREYSIENPDWGELPATFKTAHVLPGIVTEKDYQLALKIITSTPAIDLREQLAPAFLLLLCYRFGLRSAEALGLARSDWQDFGEMIAVSVQNNNLRRLKIPTTRRQVPLLFLLSDLEKDIISKWMFNVDALYGNDMSAGLFFKDRSEWDASKIHHIKSLAIASLKSATNNPQCTLHHARHAAANRVGIVICLNKMQGWERLFGDKASNRTDMEAILLGTTGPTRRKVWALGRYLGHARRKTTARNYVHFVGDLCNNLMEPVCDEEQVTLLHAINLDEFPKLESVSPELLTPPQPVKPTTYLLLKYFRLLSLGKPDGEAAYTLGIDARFCGIYSEVLSLIDKKMKFSETKYTKDKDEFDPLEFLRRITDPAWGRLLQFANLAEDRSKIKSDTLPAITLDEAAEMISANRQFIMWKTQHFMYARLFLDHFGIGNDFYDVASSIKKNVRMQSDAGRYGFLPASNDENKEKIRLDSATLNLNNDTYRVDERCAFIFKRNDELAVKSGMELAVVFLAFSIATLHR